VHGAAVLGIAEPRISTYERIQFGDWLSTSLIDHKENLLGNFRLGVSAAGTHQRIFNERGELAEYWLSLALIYISWI
jgi:hypothetical protein